MKLLTHLFGQVDTLTAICCNELAPDVAPNVSVHIALHAMCTCEAIYKMT